MSHPPVAPLRLKRNISKSLDNINEAVAKYNQKKLPDLPPVPPPRPFSALRKKKLPNPVRLPPEYEDTVALKTTPTDFDDVKTYDLNTLCKEINLPQAVEVTDGFCGPTEDIPIGHQFMIYFQKTTHVVQAKDLMGSLYSIPLNSSLQFAPIDGRDLKSPGDYSGFHYESIEEMLQERSSIPSVVQAKGNFHRGRNTVKAGDILFPKKIDKSTLGKVVGLYCTKSGGGGDVKLPLDCDCGFSTATEDTQLYLPSYIDHVNLFPIEVRMFGVDSNVKFGMPAALTLNGEHMLKSIVVRSLQCEEEIVTEMSLDLPIKVQLLDLDNELEASELERIRKVYDTFNTSAISTFLSLTETNSQHETQQQIYSKVRSELESKYCSIATPKNIVTQVASYFGSTLKDAEKSGPSSPGHRQKFIKAAGKLFSPKRHRLQSMDADDSLDHQHKMDQHTSNNATGDNGSDDFDPGKDDTLKGLDQIKKEIKQELKENLHEEIRKIRLSNARCMQQISRIGETVKELQKQINDISPATQNIPKSNSSQPSSAQSSSSESVEDFYQYSAEDNIKYLQTLDHVKVLQLLDAMRLQKYKPAFKSNFVDGQLLASLTQDELTELTVSNVLHKRKLLNIIEGKESAQKYLHFYCAEDPYVIM